ncbi:hypothetical protein N6H14_21150 [Paenibacillus sp. CC-CFT747]|nr:hypothetical protein N6H14_21150 [Paenibacillus sp. CC-CFT747]
MHAGIGAIIEGNICHGNRLYGIYTEGARTGNVIIRGNLISGMKVDRLDIPDPYTWISGIDFGPYSAALLPEEYHNYLIEGNEIVDFGLNHGSAYPIRCYFNFKRGMIQIKNNKMAAGRITHLIHLHNSSGKERREVQLDISGNQAFIRQATGYCFNLPMCSQLNIHGNQITIEQSAKREGIIALSEECLESVTMTNNHFTVPDLSAASALKDWTEPWLQDKMYKAGNFLNGRLEESHLRYPGAGLGSPYRQVCDTS